MATEAYLELFIHNQLSDFVAQSLTWFVDNLLPEAKYKIVGTYDKAVARLKQNMDQDVPILPSIMMNPTNLQLQENKSLLWQHSQLVGVPMLDRLYDPIAKTDDWALYPIFQQWQGDLEITIWLPSIYMQMDKHIRIVDFFGGTGRQVRPAIITSYIILPSTLVTAEYVNDVNHTEYVIDFTQVGASTILVPTINKNKVVFPVNLSPYYTLSDISDGSDRMGGDDIASWKLTLTIHWTCSLPIWLVLSTNKKLSAVTPMNALGRVYSKNVDDLPQSITDNAGTFQYSHRELYIIDKDTTDPEITTKTELGNPKQRIIVTGPHGYENFKVVGDYLIQLYGTYSANDVIEVDYYIM